MPQLMKNIKLPLFVSILLGLLGTPALAQTPPQFANVVATQRPGTMMVDVTYNLIDTNSPWVYVSAQFSTNGGASYFTPFSPITGDFGPVVPGTGKKLTWNAWNDFPNSYTTNAKVLLFGDDTASASGPIPTNSPSGNTNLVYIPAGAFRMGGGWSGDPVTLVYISRAFWMSKYEVTQTEYQTIMNSINSIHAGCSNCPVENISWSEAVAYCQTLTAQETTAGKLPAGWAYRLPTEAEWEYALRAGSTNTYYYGEDATYTRLANYAWFANNSGGTTHNVGLKAPNRWGLYDMLGNVAEMCSDYHGSLSGTSITDPTGPTGGGARVARGHGFAEMDVLNYFPSATRGRMREASGTVRDGPCETCSYSVCGFRVVLAPTP